MGSSILSLALGIKPKTVQPEAVRAPFRTVTGRTDTAAGDVNILRIAAEHAPVRIAAIDNEINQLEEKLLNLREEKLYVVRIAKTTEAYYAARQRRAELRKAQSVPRLVVSE